MSLNSLERVVLSLQRKEIDRPPAYPLINSISRKYCGIDYPKWSTDWEICTESIVKATDDIDVDVICTLQDLSVEAADFGQKLEYPINDAARPDMADRLVKGIPDYKKIGRVDPRKTDRMSKQIKICDALVKAKGKEKPIVSFVYGPLGVLSMMRGQAEMFLDFIDAPDMIHLALEAITDTLIDYCGAIVETGVHAIMLDTLFASQSIMSKQMWNEFEAPYAKKMAESIHSKGTMVMIHNCGNGIYFDAQIESMQPEAISFLYPPDDCKDFAETKQKYGDKTMLIGAVTPSWLLHATRQEVIGECDRQMDAMARGGGFILATGCEYPSGLSADNARAMVEAAKNYKL